MPQEGDMALRPRATGVVLQDGKVLLVRDHGHHRYSLPGGGIHRGEPAISAVARELYEETGLVADSIEWIKDHPSKTQNHKVFLISKHHGNVRRKSEIDCFIWWDGKEDVPTFSHVRDILARMLR